MSTGPPGHKRDSPRQTGSYLHLVPPVSSTDEASVTDLPGSPHCWRCGVPFAETTPETLARCTLLALSDERDTWQRAALQREREAFRRGLDEGTGEGWRLGYEAARAEQEAFWHEAASRVARGANDPTCAELERRRWTVHGEQRTRATFGRPHPADRRPAQ